MKPLLPPDSHYVSAASGWLGLSRPVEATEELKKITPGNAVHPEVLEVRWQLQARAAKWQECVDFAEGMILLAPQRLSGWLHRSQAFHELKRTQEAYDNLMSVEKKFPGEWEVSYALACYTAQLGRLTECHTWLRQAMKLDGKAVSHVAVNDANLKPLWISMVKTVKRDAATEPPLRKRIAVAKVQAHVTSASR